jgi:serine beta-lactamase-like protein LACTB
VVGQAETLASQYVAESGVSGLAVSVAIDGEIVWSEGFGFADLEQMVAVDPAKTKFRVGSTAKSMTAMGLSVLYESGKIDLDAPIQIYVPEFPEKSGTITVRMLAGHTAGIRHYKNDAEFLSAVSYASITEALTAFSNDPVLFRPGSQYSYSTQGYILLSAAIERAADQEYLSFMSENVFGPIGMKSTVADRVVPIISDRSRYYTIAGGQLGNAPWVDNSNKWASGGFLSTSEDMVRFGMAHLSGEFLKPETIEMMWTSQATSNGRDTGYGIGWNITADDAGRKIIRHSGGSVGGITELRIYPDQKLVIAVITNTAPASLTPLVNNIVSLFLTK